MEQIFNVEILTADNMTHREKIKAINDLEAIDIAYSLYNKEDIIDLKVITNE